MTTPHARSLTVSYRKRRVKCDEHRPTCMKYDPDYATLCVWHAHIASAAPEMISHVKDGDMEVMLILIARAPLARPSLSLYLGPYQRSLGTPRNRRKVRLLRNIFNFPQASMTSQSYLHASFNGQGKTHSMLSVLNHLRRTSASSIIQLRPSGLSSHLQGVPEI